ncbi:MAG: hypothetical protein U1F57_10300 [bacterium]
MSGSNAIQSNKEGPILKPDLESDEDLFGQLDEDLGYTEEGSGAQGDRFSHSGNIQDEIKRLSSGAKGLSGSTLDELNHILNLAEQYEDHHLESRAWGEVDQARVLIQQNGGLQGNGEEGDSASPKVSNPDYQDGDTAVSRVDSAKGEAVYQSNSKVVLHNYYNEDGVKTYRIKDAAEVTLYPASANDSFAVTYDKDANLFKVVVTPGSGKGQPKTYTVEPSSLSKIVIASSKVDVSKLSKEERDQVQVGLNPADDAKAKKLDIMKAVQWPSEGISPHVDFEDSNNSHAGGGGERAKEISLILDAAMKKGDWTGVRDYIVNNSSHTWNCAWTQYDDEYMNDAVRKIVSGIYRASGATSDNDPRFMAMLKKIPEDVRYALRDGALKNTSELSENHGDQWDSKRTAELISDSINSETGEAGNSATTIDGENVKKEEEVKGEES